jgi:uncharacterized protein (TIGR02266 family)
MFGNTALAYEFGEPRYDARFAVYYGHKKFGPITNYTVNMSMGGVFIETNDVFPADTEFDVDFMLPDSSEPISCRARVAWTNEPEKLKNLNLPSGMGLQFIDLSFKNLRVIRDFLDSGSLTPVW